LQDLNTVDYRMWGILQEKVYKHASLIWFYINEATDEWLPQWPRDPDWPTPFSVAVSVRPDQWWVFWTPALCYIPHTL